MDNDFRLQQWVVTHETTFYLAMTAFLKRYKLPVSDIGAVITGGAAGFDYIGHGWAIRNRISDRPIVRADWDKYGLGAGHVRNVRMEQDFHPDILLAIWNGYSTGTADMVNIMANAYKPRFIYQYEEGNR